MKNKIKALALGFQISHALGANAFIQIVSTLAPATLIYPATKSADDMIIKNAEKWQWKQSYYYRKRYRHGIYKNYSLLLKNGTMQGYGIIYPGKCKEKSCKHGARYWR